MKSVYVLMHQHKLDSMAYVRRFADIFHRAGMKVMAEEWLYQLAGEGGQPLLDGTSPKGCEAVISIGGDGTFLRANAVALEEGLPILGVNIGRVGFLTEIELDELEAACQKLAADEFTIENRMMLEVQSADQTFLALNDVVISRGGYSRLIGIDAWVDEDPIGRFLADGLIISTPTGSTGYSLSAGGPIICPELECMLLTPICAHSLQHRPVVTSAEQTITVRLHDDVQAMVSIDGREPLPFGHGSLVSITRAKRSARFIRLQPRSFFSKIRVKLSEWSC